MSAEIGASEGIAIVGMGGVLPGAPTIDAFWRNVRAGVDATTDVPATRWDALYFDPDGHGADAFYCRRGGFVDDVATFDPTAFGIMPVAAEGAEPDQLLALAASVAALADAGDPHAEVAPERVGVILGKGGYLNPAGARLDQRVRSANQLVLSLRELLPDLPEADLARVRRDFLDRLGPERPEASIGLVPNLAASRIANRLDLRGPAFTVDAACSSSHIAVAQACDELRSGRCDLVLAGGTHHCDDVTLWSVFTQLGALSREGRIRPFDAHADGILIGEGTGVFVLKRLAEAERDGDRIYAVIRGAGVASDGRGATLMSPDVTGQVLALEAAWAQSGLDPARADLVEAHGTATPTGDEVELQTLRRVFGEAVDGERRAVVGSVKSMIGHAMAAAGAAGLAKAAMALHDRVLPPTLGVDEPHEALAATRFRTIAEVEPWDAPDGALRVAGVDAFGFGGINAHLVLEEHPSSRPGGAVAPLPRVGRDRTPSDRPFAGVSGPGSVLAIAGTNPDEVRARLDAWDPEAEPGIVGEGPARLVVVDPTAKKLDLARKVLAGGRPFRGRSDVWAAPSGLIGEGGRIAWLFPGVEATFEPDLDDLAGALGRSLPAAPEGASPLEAQSRGIVAVGRLLDAAVRALGAPPDVIAGHSLGEWSGQIASGMIPDDEVDAFLDRLQPGSVEVPGVTYLALGTGADVAAELVEGIDGAFVSHDNCPHQSVVCGTLEAAALVAGRAAERKVLAQEMPFRSGFHSPLFQPYIAGLAADFGAFPLHAPHTPLWSATSVDTYPDEPDAIRALSVRHLVEPVRFRQVVERLHDEGVRAFVQMGLGSLGAFVDDTLRDRPYVALAAASPKHSGMAQIRRLAAALWVEGAAVDPVALAPIAADAASGHRRSLPAGAPGRGMRLALGTQLVRGLSPLEPSARRAIPVGDVAASLADLDAAAPGDPLVAEMQSLVAESNAAARSVLDQLATSGRRTPSPRVSNGARHHPTHAPTPPPSAPEPEPAPTSLVKEVRLSVEEQPWWLDHAFFEQPAGWTETDDLFPLVPMTGIVEMLCDAAVELVPGTVAIAVEDIRAFRWLAVSPPVTAVIRVAITGERDGATLVKAGVDGHASATIVLAPSYPEPPAPAARPLHGAEVHLPADHEGLYRERHLFHGPEYQGVREFTQSTRDGVRGVLESQTAPGALLDNAGQLFGFWAAWRVDGDRLVLPTSLQRIAFYGPLPAAGTLVDCIVNLTHIDDKTVRADLELTVDGTVWCTITEWEDRRFTTDDHLFLMLRRPQHELLAETMPGGWVLVREQWVDTATRDVVMRRFLSKAEREQYLGRNPNAQRQWLLGRVAAKDAVRGWLRQQGHGPIFPIEVTVGNDERGRPWVAHPGDEDLHVSIAHSRGLGVALVGEGRDVGIDVEVVDRRSATFEATALTDAEVALMDDIDPDRDVALTTLWAAKEAAAKAAGTGLQGRPRDFEITGLVVDGSAPGGLGSPRAPVLRVGDRAVATDRVALAAPGHEPKEHIVAWTL